MLLGMRQVQQSVRLLHRVVQQPHGVQAESIQHAGEESVSGCVQLR